MASSTEAPRSVNFKGITKKGWDCMFTVRAVDNENLLDDMKDLIDKLEASGVVPKGNGKPAPVSPNTPPPATAESKALLESAGIMAPVQTPALTNPDAAYTFDAERLVGSTSGDKVYWKVQGGQFSQYGVTIWPEVAEAAGFHLDQFDPQQEYDISGYTAYYTLNDKGKPNKVVNLAK